MNIKLTCLSILTASLLSHQSLATTNSLPQVNDILDMECIAIYPVRSYQSYIITPQYYFRKHLQIASSQNTLNKFADQGLNFANEFSISLQPTEVSKKNTPISSFDPNFQKFFYSLLPHLDRLPTESQLNGNFSIDGTSLHIKIKETYGTGGIVHGDNNRALEGEVTSESEFNGMVLDSLDPTQRVFDGTMNITESFKGRTKNGKDQPWNTRDFSDQPLQFNCRAQFISGCQYLGDKIKSAQDIGNQFEVLSSFSKHLKWTDLADSSAVTSTQSKALYCQLLSLLSQKYSSCSLSNIPVDSSSCPVTP